MRGSWSSSRWAGRGPRRRWRAEQLLAAGSRRSSVSARLPLTLGAVVALALASCSAPARAERCEGQLGWHLVPGADGTPREARLLATWLAQWPADELDRELLLPEEIAALNERNAGTIGAWHDQLVQRQPDPDAVAAELRERMDEIGRRVATGEYVEDEPGAFGDVERRVASANPTDEIRVVHTITDLRCVPLASGLYRKHIDKLFDRNQCSRLHPGEIVRVLRRTPDERWMYGRAGHGVGWVDPAALGPPMTWGGTGSGRDCSGLLLDAAASAAADAPGLRPRDALRHRS